MVEKINKYIDNLPLNIEPDGLYAPIRYSLSVGGKRLRPVLMMLAYELWKENGEDVLQQAVALEMYHNFTLLHDDVMDNADMRRGRPTVHKKWDVNTAILSGDNMLCLAVKWMGTDPEVARTFIATMIEINHGQQFDVDFEKRDDVTEAEYIEMIRLKTSVLLACALKIGALMAGAPQEDVDRLYDFGVSLGLAFQLQDDYLDVYGDPEKFGKKIGGDILCNKKTYMLINAMRLSDNHDWLNADYASPEEKIAAVTGIYNTLGIDKMAQAKIEEYYSKALEALNSVNVPEERKTALRKYASEMMKRQK
jgi:geranylgeranyl diphosphate synthase type II